MLLTHGSYQYLIEARESISVHVTFVAELVDQSIALSRAKLF